MDLNRNYDNIYDKNLIKKDKNNLEKKVKNRTH